EQPPSPEVAAFLGFAGRLEEPAGIRMVRPAHVRLDPAGPFSGRVERRVPLEDGVRVELALDEGNLVAIAPLPGPEPGETARLRVDGGVLFPRAGRETPSQSESSFRLEGQT